MKRVLVDGRVFSTSAYDRGMGRYVMHLLDLLAACDCDITVLLFRNCYLNPDHPVVGRYATRFANYDPEQYIQDDAQRSSITHEFTAYLSGLIEVEGFDVYIDSTPFLGPMRLDIFSCAVVAVCYDFIPLKHPEYYLSADGVRRVYYNGLARLSKADHVLCISETVCGEALRYLGIGSDRLAVITPTLEESYLNFKVMRRVRTDDKYLFNIQGSHKSKNPAGAMAIYAQILDSGWMRVRVNAPTSDQMGYLRDAFDVGRAIELTHSISEEEKFELQAGATLIAHLSFEEGFGIPLLEGLFLGRKILALDTPINREFFDKAPEGLDSAVFLLSPENSTLDVEALRRFVDAPANPAFFESIREAYRQHWAMSPKIMADTLDRAVSHYDRWGAELQAKIFSSIPGTACGVADYSVAYTRSADGNVMFFFSEGEPENITYLPNLRLGTYLDFDRFTRSKFAAVPGLFNFAFSSALHPGIELMRTSAKPGDVLLIHERRYFDGLRMMQVVTNRTNDLLLDFALPETPEHRTQLARNCVFHPLFNARNAHPEVASPIASAWLRELPVRAVSHLPPAVLKEMHRQAELEPGSVVNDLEALEQEFDFVPLGIDDRRHPSIARAAQRLRRLRLVQPDDIVVGHCGLILNDLKRLWDVVSGFLAYAEKRQRETPDQRRLFFFLVGKVIDQDLFASIRAAFARAGLADRLVHSNPAEEADFDAEIAACDAVACFRIQTRGQLSHVFVRALSLGTPVLVNQRSGYAYDPRTTVDDEDLAGGMAAAIDQLFDRAELASMRSRARQEYQKSHRGDISLHAILRTEGQ
jgi:glycosyltransferase involved in cell wall biosynthesis